MPRIKKIAGKPYKRGDMCYARLNGVRRSLGTVDLAAAQAYCDKLNLEGFTSAGLGVAPKRSWQEAVVMRMREVSGSTTAEDQQRYLKFWHPYLGNVEDINTITQEQIEEIILRERADVVPGKKVSGNTTANKYVKAVQTILNHAARDWGWKTTAPKLRLYPEPNGRKLALTAEQVWRGIERLPEHSRDIALYACATMHRRGNITGLRWEWIDMERQILTIPGADADTGDRLVKNGEDIVIPLNDTAMSVLKRRATASDRHPTLVFHWRGEKIHQVVTKRWRREWAATMGGKTKVLLHTMRHSAASWLVQRGINEATIAWLGGWALPTQLGAMKRYLHAQVERLRPFSKMLDEELMVGKSVYEAEKEAISGHVVPKLSQQPIMQESLAT